MTRGLCHTFGPGGASVRVLHDVDLEIRSGEVVILMGPSGSGKTTVLTLVGCLRSVRQGSVKLLGEELNGASDQTLMEMRPNLLSFYRNHNASIQRKGRRAVISNREYDVEVLSRCVLRDMDQRSRFRASGKNAFARPSTSCYGHTEFKNRNKAVVDVSDPNRYQRINAIHFGPTGPVVRVRGTVVRQRRDGCDVSLGRRSSKIDKLEASSQQVPRPNQIIRVPHDRSARTDQAL